MGVALESRDEMGYTDHFLEMLFETTYLDKMMI
jgi:hypothetical protein